MTLILLLLVVIVVVVVVIVIVIVVVMSLNKKNSQRINTNFLQCRIYMLFSSPSCFGLT